MARRAGGKRRLWGGAGLALLLSCGAMSGQAAQGAAGGHGRSCAVQHVQPNDANLALANGEYAKAAALFEATLKMDPESRAAKEGLVRSRVGEGKLAEAVEVAKQYAAAAPNDGMLEDALGEAYFRQGEVVEAAEAFNAALHADPCLGRVHYNLARFQRLNGNFLTAQKQVDVAHQLSPDDAEITVLWSNTHAKRPTAEERITRLTKSAARSDATEEQKKASEEEIKRIQAEGNGSCTLADPVDKVKVKLAPINAQDGSLAAVGLDMEINGKRRRLEVDTGASGLTLTRRAAAALGLLPEAETRIGGIGEQGSIRTFVAHIDTLRIGSMEFHNCEVDVLGQNGGMETDGLIGPDVFGRWVVTVDTPMRELRLEPLPKRPGEDAANAGPLGLETHGASGIGQQEDGEPHDRYIAPEMADWTRVYRRNHDLIVPARVNQLPPRLFIMDTGAFSATLMPELARQLGHVSEVDTIVHGLSGTMNHVYTVDQQVTIDFAGVRQALRGITVMDTARMTGVRGVEISGFIGFKTLRELAISIDYRDNLVKVVFDPKHGFHANGSMEY